MRFPSLLAASAAIALGATRAPAQQAERAHAELRNTQGVLVGQAMLQQTARGVLIDLTLSGVPEGEHALHVHGVGKCEAPFSSAGGHWNPTAVPHGLLTPKGGHLGDLPNIFVPAGGHLHVQVMADGAKLTGLDGMLDADGAALMIHNGPDDYASDPAGAAGPRIACGVIVAG